MFFGIIFDFWGKLWYNLIINDSFILVFVVYWQQ